MMKFFLIVGLCVTVICYSALAQSCTNDRYECPAPPSNYAFMDCYDNAGYNLGLNWCFYYHTSEASSPIQLPTSACSSSCGAGCPASSCTPCSKILCRSYSYPTTTSPRPALQCTENVVATTKCSCGPNEVCDVGVTCKRNTASGSLVCIKY